MLERSYTSSIEKLFIIIKLGTIYLLHIRRDISPGCLGIEEIDELDKRTIGNWVTDVFGSQYKVAITVMILGEAISFIHVVFSMVMNPTYTCQVYCCHEWMES